MKKWILPLLLAAAILALYFGYRALPRDAATEADRLTLYGNVDIREVQLAFNGSERIREIRVQEGDRVHKGQRLALLDTRLLEARLAEAEAAVEAQRQQLARLEAGSRPEEIRKAEADLEAAKAQARSARDSHRRIKRLLEQKLASPQDEEQARSLAEAAEARLRAVEASLALIKAGPRDEDIAAARAQLAARLAAREQVRRQLANASLYAPDDGIIRNRILEPGDMAFPQTPVLTLALVNPVWVRAYLPEPLLGRVKPGAAAWITSDSYPDTRYRGWVGYISPTAEFTPKTVQTPELRTRLVYPLRVYACNPAGELRLGMPVTVEIDLKASAAEDRKAPCGAS